mmetsp:Transcript_7981/g.19824  ORF Transcript_7981/g.19824 Transcript_7981/m.19824 type:complete len:94 (+) Transcript_7981:1623-1904(+)
MVMTTVLSGSESEYNIKHSFTNSVWVCVSESLAWKNELQRKVMKLTRIKEPKSWTRQSIADEATKAAETLGMFLPLCIHYSLFQVALICSYPK